MFTFDFRWLYLVDMAFIYLNLMVWLYIAYTKLEVIENHLNNCDLVKFNRRIWGGGPLGRMYRLMQISGILVYPKVVVKNGGGDLEEIRNLPTPLRRWIKIPFITGLISFVSLFILIAWDEFVLST